MKILSTVYCCLCYFKYETYNLMLGYSQCPRCLGKNLKLIEQKEAENDTEN